MTSYKDSGVDVEAGNRFVKDISSYSRATYDNNVLSGLGGFGALYKLPEYNTPVLVSGSDGVGTKLKLAIDVDKYDTIGIDLVAMCVNDVIVSGAKPLFFQDYYATGKLNIETGKDIIKGIAQGCLDADCSLVGGETAEMPGLYKDMDFDLAGFCVGVVEQDEIITGEDVHPGDVILGLKSSGFHSNGFSLIRKILNEENPSLDEQKDFLAPTRIYVKPVLALLEKVNIYSIAHITGGGLIENIPRTLPDYTCAEISTKNWTIPDWYYWITQFHAVSFDEIFRTFNCGIGMTLVVSPNDVRLAIDILEQHGESVNIIGKIKNTNTKNAYVEILE